MRLDLGPLDHLPQHRDFALEAKLEPIALGGETVELVRPVRIEGHVDRMHGGAMLDFRVEARVRLRCGRCLDRYDETLRPRVERVLAGPVMAQEGIDGDDVLAYADHLDLEPVVEEALVLELPTRPLCREDCLGLCARCGEPKEACACEPERDERWAVLGDFIKAHGEPAGARAKAHTEPGRRAGERTQSDK